MAHGLGEHGGEQRTLFKESVRVRSPTPPNNVRVCSLFAKNVRHFCERLRIGAEQARQCFAGRAASCALGAACWARFVFGGLFSARTLLDERTATAQSARGIAQCLEIGFDKTVLQIRTEKESALISSAQIKNSRYVLSEHCCQQSLDLDTHIDNDGMLASNGITRKQLMPHLRG